MVEVQELQKLKEKPYKLIVGGILSFLAERQNIELPFTLTGPEEPSRNGVFLESANIREYTGELAVGEVTFAFVRDGTSTADIFLKSIATGSNATLKFSCQILALDENGESTVISEMSKTFAIVSMRASFSINKAVITCNCVPRVVGQVVGNNASNIAITKQEINIAKNKLIMFTALLDILEQKFEKAGISARLDRPADDKLYVPAEALAIDNYEGQDAFKVFIDYTQSKVKFLDGNIIKDVAVHISDNIIQLIPIAPQPKKVRKLFYGVPTLRVESIMDRVLDAKLEIQRFAPGFAISTGKAINGQVEAMVNIPSVKNVSLLEERPFLVHGGGWQKILAALLFQSSELTLLGQSFSLGDYVTVISYLRGNIFDINIPIQSDPLFFGVDLQIVGINHVISAGEGWRTTIRCAYIPPDQRDRFGVSQIDIKQYKKLSEVFEIEEAFAAKAFGIIK
jgi:hypothetical protein